MVYVRLARLTMGTVYLENQILAQLQLQRYIPTHMVGKAQQKKRVSGTRRLARSC